MVVGGMIAAAVAAAVAEGTCGGVRSVARDDLMGHDLLVNGRPHPMPCKTYADCCALCKANHSYAVARGLPLEQTCNAFSFNTVSGCWMKYSGNGSRPSTDMSGILENSTDSIVVLPAGELKLTVEPATLTLRVVVAGVEWLAGSAFVQTRGSRLSPADGSLILAQPPAQTQGIDELGQFSALNLTWTAANVSAHSEFRWECAVRAYASGILAFWQSFPAGTIVGASPRGSSGWPALFVPKTPEVRLGFLEYHGSSAGNMVDAGTNFPHGVQGGRQTGAIVLVPDPKGTAKSVATRKHTMVFSATDNFFGSAVDLANVTAPWGATVPAVSAGLASGFVSAPPGFASESALVLVSDTDNLTIEMFGMPAGGPNHAIQRWGDVLLTKHGGKPRAAVAGSAASVRATHFGYSTTAFYHHNPCDGLDASCKTWEDTLLTVHADLRARGVPYHWMLIDSYWYGESRYDGNWLWEDGTWITSSDPPKWPQRFSHGLSYLHAQMNLTFAAHSGHWAKNTPYANQSDPRAVGTWAMDRDRKTPVYPQGRALWDHLFSKNTFEWGLSMIKQDHISENPFQPDDPAAWDRWFDGMASSAADHGVRIMYCMAPAPVLLNSVRFRSAEATRASSDYIVGLHKPQMTNGQWAIGPDAAFHWALGLLPYKDTLYSNTTERANHTEHSLQPSSTSASFNGIEPHPELHATLAALSAAFVTASDAVGAANVTLLSRLYRADGILLKPTRPVTAVDAQFLRMMFVEESEAPHTIYSTVSAIDVSMTGGDHVSQYRWSFVLATQLKADYILSLSEIGLSTVSSWATYLHLPWGDGQPPVVSTVTASGGLTFQAATKQDPYSTSFRVVAPIFLDGQLAILGELNKTVPIATQRIANISINSTLRTATIGLIGAPEEVVAFSFAVQDREWLVQAKRCTIGSHGGATLSIQILNVGIVKSVCEPPVHIWEQSHEE